MTSGRGITSTSRPMPGTRWHGRIPMSPRSGWRFFTADGRFVGMVGRGLLGPGSPAGRQGEMSKEVRSLFRPAYGVSYGVGQPLRGIRLWQEWGNREIFTIFPEIFTKKWKAAW